MKNPYYESVDETDPLIAELIATLDLFERLDMMNPLDILILLEDDENDFLRD